MRIKTTVEVEVPRPPSFLRQTDGKTIPIEALTKNAILAVARGYTQRLLDHWCKRCDEAKKGDQP